MSGFMKPEVTGKTFGYGVTLDNGSFFWVPGFLSGEGHTAPDVHTWAESLKQYAPEGVDTNGKVISTGRLDGYFARLSAPGYMDCTDWEFFTNKRTAERTMKRQARGED